MASEPRLSAAQDAPKPGMPQENITALKQWLALKREKGPRAITGKITAPKDKVNMVEALRSANGRRIAPNSYLDALIGKGAIKIDVWTGTMIIYQEPDKPFGSIVTVYQLAKGNHIDFVVPQEYIGLKNTALVLESPDIMMDDVGRVTGHVIGIVEDLPQNSGWYVPDDVFGIPHGKEKSKADRRTRSFVREEKSYISGGGFAPFIGLLCRELKPAGLDDRCISAHAHYTLDYHWVPWLEKDKI